MKLNITKTVIACLIGVVCAAPIYASETATYQNQRGSVLTLTWDDTQMRVSNSMSQSGILTGTFTSAVGQCAAGKSVPVAGNYNGNAIALTFNYPQCKVVVALTGNLTNGNEEIHTMWLVTAQTPDSQNEDWNANTTGADHFKKKH